MRLTKTLLLATVALMALPSCSSAKGPGAVGTTDDIVVRNYGDAPLPPSATLQAAAPQGSAEAMLQQEAGTPPDMMASKTADAQAAVATAQAGVENTAQAPLETPEAAQQGMQVGQTQMQRQAAVAQQQATTAGLEAVPAPIVEPQSLAEQATQTMPAADMAEAAADTTRPATTAAGTAGVISPDVNAGLETRTPPQLDRPGEVIGEVTAPAVDQAAEEYQNKGPEQAAAEALQNAPTPAAAAPGAQPVPRAPGVAPSVPVDAAPAVAASAAAPVATTTATGDFRPTPEDIAAGGMRVVRSVPPAGVALAPSAPVAAPVSTPSAPVAAPAPAPSAPAPVATSGGTPVMDKAMITRAQAVLTEKGLYAGPADGVMSTATLNALSRYQSANGLTPGAMTVQTAQHMGLIQ